MKLKKKSTHTSNRATHDYSSHHTRRRPLHLLFTSTVALPKKKVSEKFSLENKKQSAQNKYEFMVGHRRSLKEELADKERQLQTLRNSQEGIKTISASDLDISDVSDDEKVSRYLIQEGKIRWNK